MRIKVFLLAIFDTAMELGPDLIELNWNTDWVGRSIPIPADELDIGD